MPPTCACVMMMWACHVMRAAGGNGEAWVQAWARELALGPHGINLRGGSRIATRVRQCECVAAFKLVNQ